MDGPASLAAAPDARRGDAARQALLRAGIDLFGRLGLEGATTRELARAAGQNIAAIPYHFGSKEGLYLAVAGHLLDTVFERHADLFTDLEALLAGGRATPAQLLEALHTLTVGLLTVFTSEETVPASRILAREQIDPSAAFDLFYERAIGRAHRCVAGVLDQYSGLGGDGVDSALRAHVLLGSLLGFRVAVTTILRRTGWSALGAEQVRRIEGVAVEHALMYARALRAQARRRRAAPAAPARRARPSR